MIIKILPIKSFSGISRVASYIATDKGMITDYREQGVFQNTISTDLGKIVDEFKTNFSECASSRVKNKGLHCILSTSPADREKMNVDIMNDIVNTFITKAYPNALVFGQHHKELQHYHTHLLISGNELCSPKSTRLSKEKLRSVHLELLEYIRTKYPQFTVSFSAKEYGRKNFSERTYYSKKRNPNLVLTKEILAEKVQQIFHTVQTLNGFKNLLNKEGLQTYTFKGKMYGILTPENRKYRFSRLGLPPEKIENLNRFDERMKDLENIRFMYSKQRNTERE